LSMEIIVRLDFLEFCRTKTPTYTTDKFYRVGYM
jgi:hypothetical protein